jgi:hypothetical protein
MANGHNAKRNHLRDWWGKRPLSHHSVSKNSKVNKFFKRLLHKIERKQGDKQIKNEI